jgi:chemotaxis protein histidine kinase CheA/chemotaxis protein CheY-P-specific phosphatase CheC
MDGLLRVYETEAQQLLERTTASLRSLSESFTESEFDTVFRSVHTLKSSSLAIGYHDLGALLHGIESAWDSNRQTHPSQEFCFKLLRIFDAVTEALQEGALGNNERMVRIDDFWKGKSLLPETKLVIPPDVHLSSQLYDRMLSSTESVLNAKMRIAVLGGSLIRSLQRMGKEEGAVESEYLSATKLLDRATLELESSLRNARMTPLAVFFHRLPFLVKDVGRSLHKDVTLTVVGEEIQADRLVISELGGALGHLVRNAIDHGLAEAGEIVVRAQEQHDHILVSVEDNGRGIQYDRLEAIARKEKIIEEGVQLSDDAKKELMFHPRISTSLRVTEFSGRGVGMSSVREYVRSVGGTVSVESPLLNGGTRITLRIPASISLIRIIVVRSGHATFGIPVTDLLRTTPFDPHMVKKDNGHHVVARDNTMVRFFHLRDTLGRGGGYYSRSTPLLLYLDTPEHGIAVCVDAVLHDEEVLVKALPKILSPITMFRGAATIGDGRTILVLDAAGLSKAPILLRTGDNVEAKKLSALERDQLMEIMNMVASHAGTALSRRFGSHIELSIPECSDGLEKLPEEDWGASAIGVKMILEGEYPGRLLFEMPEILSMRLTEHLHSQKTDLHNLSSEERAFFQEIGQIAMHAVGNMLSQISKHPVMTKMSDVRVDARGALRTFFLSGHDDHLEELVRVRLWFGVGEGIRTDDHRETGSLTMELRREDAIKLLHSTTSFA